MRHTRHETVRRTWWFKDVSMPVATASWPSYKWQNPRMVRAWKHTDKQTNTYV